MMTMRAFDEKHKIEVLFAPKGVWLNDMQHTR
jgi:hypothetical protein